jgi:hypothetical protein
MKRRTLWHGLAAANALALAAGAAWPTQAAEATPQRRYVTLSMIGDKLTVVTYVPSSSSVDVNQRSTLPVNDATFDKDALRAVAQQLGRADPGAPLAFLLANLHSHYDNHDKLFTGARLELPAELLDAVRGTKATHLILVSKRRGEAKLRLVHSVTGTGRLEGLGFYLDHQMRNVNSETQEVAIGFIAPYVYADVTLVDLATLDIVKSVPVTAAVGLFASRAQGGIGPWDAITPNRKVELIRTLIAREIGAATAEVLKR